MKRPEDIQLNYGEIADYWLDNEGVLYTFSKNPKRTVENISACVALVKKITGGRKVPLLIYLSNSPVPDRATRKFAAEQLPTVYIAMAMVSKPGLSKLIMNILFKLKTPPIPMKSFSDDNEAREWFQQYL